MVDSSSITQDSDLAVQYLGKNRADSKIKLLKPAHKETGILKKASKLLNKFSGVDEEVKKEGLNRIRMDRQDFGYNVYSEDELTAYKALTPDVLETIMAYGSQHSISQMILNRNVIELNMDYSDLNLDPRYKFYSKMAKNRELYTDDCLKSKSKLYQDRTYQRQNLLLQSCGIYNRRRKECLRGFLDGQSCES